MNYDLIPSSPVHFGVVFIRLEYDIFNKSFFVENPVKGLVALLIHRLLFPFSGNGKSLHHVFCIPSVVLIFNNSLGSDLILIALLLIGKFQ